MLHRHHLKGSGKKWLPCNIVKLVLLIDRIQNLLFIYLFFPWLDMFSGAFLPKAQVVIRLVIFITHYVI